MVGKVSNKKMLSDKIVAKLNKPKSVDYDIEDEEFNYNKSDKSHLNDEIEGSDDDDNDEKEHEEFTKRQHYVNVSKSKLRDDSLNLGERYTGAKVGRYELFDDETKTSVHDSTQEDESEEEVDDDSILADVTDSELEEDRDQNGENAGYSHEESSLEENNDYSENDDENYNEDDDEVYKRNRIAKLLDTEKEQILNRLSTSAKADTLKGYTILRQSAEYDRILDSRIKFQKAVVASNLLPINHEIFEKNKTNKTNAILESTEKKLYELIERLIRLRANQLEADNLIKNKIDVNLKKRKLEDYLEANSNIDNVCVPIRKSILMKWSNKVQSASGLGALNQGKFSVINQNVWTQVNNQLGDLERLVKKTKINRRGAIPIGYNEEEEKKENSNKSDSDDDDDDDELAKRAGLSNIDKSLQTNQYIFDDDDFYRLLLNDMINKKLDQKQANSSAILMLSKSKMQKNYDRMATKGRKLKFTVQEPLVQYEIPKRKYYSWGDDQIDELFAGLFGMTFNISESDASDDENSQDEQQKEDIGALKESGVKLFG